MNFTGINIAAPDNAFKEPIFHPKIGEKFNVPCPNCKHSFGEYVSPLGKRSGHLICSECKWRTLAGGWETSTRQWIDGTGTTQPYEQKSKEPNKNIKKNLRLVHPQQLSNENKLERDNKCVRCGKATKVRTSWLCTECHCLPSREISLREYQQLYYTQGVTDWQIAITIIQQNKEQRLQENDIKELERQEKRDERARQIKIIKEQKIQEKNIAREIRRKKSIEEYQEHQKLLDEREREKENNPFRPTGKPKIIELTIVDSNDYFTVSEVIESKILNIQQETLRMHLSCGRITTYKFKHMTLISKKEIVEFQGYRYSKQVG